MKTLTLSHLWVWRLVAHPQFNIRLWLLLLSFSLHGIATGQTFVNLTATGANNGTSWSDAYTDLKMALDSTTSGEIWVASGIYYPSDSNKFASFTLQPGVQVYGGFNGQESTLSQRDISANPTILSGDIGQDDLKVVADTTTDIVGENSIHVVVIPGGADSTTILDGCTIVAGSATESSSFNSQRGAGLACFPNALPTRFQIRNCRFQANVATIDGGGLGVLGDQNVNIAYTIENCTFLNNVAGWGGGLFSRAENGSQHKPLITRSTFIGNVAETLGGGIETEVFTSEDSTVLSYCYFEGNYAARGGGTHFLLFTRCYGKITVDSCNFVQNTSGGFAGGLNIATVTPSGLQPLEVTVSRSVFEENEAVRGGGLIILSEGSASPSPNQLTDVELIDCEFRKNVAKTTETGQRGFAGGFRAQTLVGKMDLDMRDCLFSENEADVSGAFEFISENRGTGTLVMEECQFLDNVAEEVSAAAVVSLANSNADTATAISFIRDCVFEGNAVALPTEGGGALGLISLYNATLQANVSRSSFLHNTSEGVELPGGAMTITGNKGVIDVEIDSSQFIGNASMKGGAIGLLRYRDTENTVDVSLEIQHSLFEHNDAQEGGALYALQEDAASFHIEFRNDTLIQNTSQNQGGGIYASNKGQAELNVNMLHSRMIQDSSVQGGAIYVKNESTGSTKLETESSLFLGNYAAWQGGAAYVQATNSTVHSTLRNATLYGNQSNNSGGGIFYDQSGTGQGQNFLFNSLFAYNTALQDSDIALNNGAIVNPFATLTQDSSTNLSVIVGDPGFIDPLGPDGQIGTGDEDLHLNWNSPAINAGFNSFVTTSLDLDGNMRIQRDTVDIGAYESSFATSIEVAPFPTFQVFPNPATDILFVKGLKQGEWQIDVKDVHGRLLFQQAVRSSGEEKTIDVSPFTPGIYLITCSSQNQQFTIKFLKK